MSREARVLIAVAEGQLAQILGKLLETVGGYSVVRASAAAEAEARAGEGFLALALLDLRLPDMEGIELLQRLKQTHPLLEGIILAGDPTAQVVTEVLQKGAFACLAKPPDRDELLQAIQKALQKQRLESERQDNERMKLISTIAHELRSPLTSIALSADLLASEIPRARQESLSRLVENITDSARKMDQWVQDLLDLARLQTVEHQLQLDLADIGSMLQRAAAAARACIEGIGQSLILEVVEPLPRAWIDKQGMERVVVELLAVASKHTPAGGKIVLRAREEKPRVLVEVLDSASSIPQDVVERFSYPYPAVLTDKRYLARLGLGVALARRVIELHGGEMWIESGAQGGNVFAFSLPLSRPVTGPDAAGGGGGYQK